MKILVPVKRVVDYNVKVRVKNDNSGVELENVKMSMNPFDEIAVEEALRLKEKGIANEVVAISIGASQVQETIRNALAMGADSGIFVETNDTLEPLNIAKIITSIAKKDASNWASDSSRPANPLSIEGFSQLIANKAIKINTNFFILWLI